MRIQIVAAALALAWSGAASAETIQLHAMLTASAEVASSATPPTGEATATYDTETKLFTYQASYSGLSGPATAAHFHGPAEPGANAPPVVPIDNPASPMSGSATLTDAQAADLLAGRWYLNVHTEAHRPGEIRGQLMRH